MDSNGFSDPYIKMYLKPDPEKVTKRKSRVHPRTLNPKFFEEFFWDLPQGELASKRLEVTSQSSFMTIMTDNRLMYGIIIFI